MKSFVVFLGLFLSMPVLSMSIEDQVSIKMLVSDDEKLLDVIASRIWAGRNSLEDEADALVRLSMLLIEAENPRYYTLMKKISEFKYTDKKLRTYTRKASIKSKVGYETTEQFLPG